MILSKTHFQYFLPFFPKLPNFFEIENFKKTLSKIHQGYEFLYRQQAGLYLKIGAIS